MAKGSTGQAAHTRAGKGSIEAFVINNRNESCVFFCFSRKIAAIPNKYGLLYKNIGYNTRVGRAELLKRVLNVQKRVAKGDNWLDSR